MGGTFESVDDLERFVNNKDFHNPLTPKIMDEDVLNFIRRDKKKMEGLVEGRIVHFVLDKFINEVEAGRGMESFETEVITCRPAIIVNAWGGKLEDGMINIIVFLDGNNDYDNLLKQEVVHDKLQMWLTSVKYSESKETGTWHWPERN